MGVGEWERGWCDYPGKWSGNYVGVVCQSASGGIINDLDEIQILFLALFL